MNNYDPGMPNALEMLSVAHEVWIATALLHREQPGRADFTLTEIVERARAEGMSQDHRPGLRPHASRHCVANVPPSPARHRMLFETGPSRRRLYRPGDPVHAGRRNGRVTPDSGTMPEAYLHLLDWYAQEWASTSQPDPLLALYGTGRDLWPEGADAFVRELREGWE